jgi:hypothetical protein
MNRIVISIHFISRNILTINGYIREPPVLANGCEPAYDDMAIMNKIFNCLSVIYLKKRTDVFASAGLYIT